MLQRPPWPRLEVVPVKDGARAFTALPYRLYRDDPCWIPPLRGEERRRWSTRSNASLRSRGAQQFLALRGGEVVGRIAAIVDRAFARRWEPGAGLFGFFECADDPEAAAALLTAAERFLVRCGCWRVIGPVNLTMHDETGLLVHGFESPPMVLSPYNPPFYAQLIAGAGYGPCRDYHAYLGTPDAQPAPGVRRLARSPRVAIRCLDPRRWDAEVRTVFELYNAAFADVWGFVPIGWEEFVERATRFKPFVRAELVLIAEDGGEPVGFALSLPDVNEALAPLGGRLWPLGWLRLARRLPHVKGARFILLGVSPERFGRGIGALLALETLHAVRRLGIERLEVSLVLADNSRVRRVIEAFGCPIIKTFRLYEKTIGASAAAAKVEKAGAA